jgi:transcriptional regulator with XRE-family HTH domain
MGRHEEFSGWHAGSGSASLYRREYGKVLGERIRRLRRTHGLTVYDLSARIRKPGAKVEHFSASYYARIERGYTSAALYSYVAIAELLDLSPARLMGLDEWETTVTEGEMTLLRFLRSARIEPHVAIAKITAS